MTVRPVAIWASSLSSASDLADALARPYVHPTSTAQDHMPKSPFTPLYCSVDPDSAYTIDIPNVGRARYWLHAHVKWGFRQEQQTWIEELGGDWGPVRRSPYSHFAGNLYLDRDGFVRFAGVDMRAQRTAMLAFVCDFPCSDLSRIQERAQQFIPHLQDCIKGKAVRMVYGVARPYSEAELRGLKSELSEWLAIDTLIANTITSRDRIASAR